MRIGELAREVGIAPDTVRFWERSGSLPRPSRRANSYREYDDRDVEHLRLLIELRRLDVPLADAARIANWCHSGHCAEATTELPGLIAERRADIARRIASLRALDDRLDGLAHHLGRGSSPSVERSLPMLDGAMACCDAAEAVVASPSGDCACCRPAVAMP